jgi:hypothetical protein
MCILGQQLQQPSRADSYTVLYTGEMLGYFRMPELQLDKFDSCPTAPERNSAAWQFQRSMANALENQIGTTVRVAVGNNLAPYLLSRKIWNNGEFHDKGSVFDGSDDRYSQEHRTYTLGEGTIHADNVACFILATGFDALVPGIHDFYFGPERLREVARFLRERSNGATRLLAANMALQTRNIDVNQPGGIAALRDPSKPTGSVPPPEDGIKAALPKVVLPWMRAVRIKNAFSMQVSRAGAVSRSPQVELMAAHFSDAAQGRFSDWLKSLPQEKGPVDVPSETTQAAQRASYTFTPKLEKACIVAGQPSESKPKCDDPRFVLQPAPDNPVGPDAEYELPAGGPLLEPGGSYSVCLVEPAAWSCIPFDVQHTFFEYPRTAEQIRTHKELKPWVLKKPASDELAVALFGVVDPDLMQSVGRLNYTWLGEDRVRDHYANDDSYETVVQVAQPGESLKQVLRYCLQDPECNTAHKVLLAQMPEQDAYGIVGQLQALKGLPASAAFELIVSQIDSDRASGDRIIVRTTPVGSDRPQKKARREMDQPIVVVPGSHLPSEDLYDLQVRLQKAIVTPNPAPHDTTTIAGERLIRNSVSWGDSFRVNPLDSRQGLSIAQPQSSLLDRLNGSPHLLDGTDLANRATPTFQQAESGFEQVALKVMREACHADAAFLQHRDIFLTEVRTFLSSPVDNSWAQALVDAILWKGDFIQCIEVTGDVINSLLKRSKELQDDEDNGIDTDLALGWGLATLGVDEEAPQEKRLIGGQYIDPKKLYSVAITDYLANGDTGYPALQNAIPLPADKWSRTKLLSLSRAVGGKLIGGSIPSPSNATDLLDSADHYHPPSKPQPGFRDWWAGWLQGDKTGGIQSSLERHAQRTPVWSISLYKADAGFSMFYHNGTESQLGQRFPGVSSADLSSPNSQTITFDYMLRVQRSADKSILYLESDLNYGHKANRTSTYQRSQSADYWYHELGWAVRIVPGHQNPAGLKFLVPVALRTQLWPPITQITPAADTPPPPGMPPSKAITGQAPINFFPSFRPGFRFDYALPKPAPSAASGAGGAQGQGPGGKGQPGQPQTSQLWTSFVEFGFEAGRLLNGPSQFIFNPNTPTELKCPVSDPTCVLTAPYGVFKSVEVDGGRNHTQKGFYFDFRWDMPLPRLKDLEFVAESRGDFYVFGAPRDSAVDTRLFNDAKAALIVPIPGLRKLSLAPTFEWIVFRNKIADNTYYAASMSVSLSYSFDWHQGLAWKRVLGFSNSVPALPTLPTR